MNLRIIKANMTEVNLGNTVVLFSYNTPVACYTYNKDGNIQTYYKTEKRWSNTTSRHINTWIVKTDGWTERKIETKPQSYFDSLIQNQEVSR